MAKITGLGGAFVRAANPKALYAWYEQHLGSSSPEGSFCFPRETLRGRIAAAFFSKTSQYFPVSQPAMLNFQVDGLEGVLDRLEASGVAVDPKREDHDYGRFGWFEDREGNRVELWQPPEGGLRLLPDEGIARAGRAVWIARDRVPYSVRDQTTIGVDRATTFRRSAQNKASQARKTLPGADRRKLAVGWVDQMSREGGKFAVRHMKEIGKRHKL